MACYKYLITIQTLRMLTRNVERDVKLYANSI